MKTSSVSLILVVCFAAVCAIVFRTLAHAGPSYVAVSALNGKPTAPLPARRHPGGRNVTPYASTSGVAGSQKLISLCEVLKMLGGPAGVFHVESLTGVTEDDDSPATYVELTLVKDWAGDAPKQLVARISGGPTAAPGVTALWRVSLREGEDVGLVIGQPRDDNRGFYSLHNLGIFRMDANRGATNGQLFVTTRASLDDIGSAVGRLRAAQRRSGDVTNCKGDIAPDYEKLRTTQTEGTQETLLPVEKAVGKGPRGPFTTSPPAPESTHDSPAKAGTRDPNSTK